MNYTKHISPVVLKFVQLYVAAVVIFFVFRLLLFITEVNRIDDTVQTADILYAFIMGIRFDIVITGYLLLLPYLILSFAAFYPTSTSIYKLVKTFITITFSLAFLICAIDIPYFHQFFSRLSVTALEWLDSPLFVLKMIFQEPTYWIYLVPLLLAIILFSRITRLLLKTTIAPTASIRTLPISLLFLGLIVLGIRGRIEEKSPIRIGTAYFSNNAFLNQLGLNPNFTFLKSYLESRKEENQKVQLMDESLALANVQRYFNIQQPDKNFPLARAVHFDSLSPSKYNVVVVIMESLGAVKMRRHGNENNLTPFLDSLTDEGYYFENTYTSGIHTYNGIYSTLFSYPALFIHHPMKGHSLVKQPGAFSTLKENGYSTIYFTTHDGQFDNVEGFLKANDCETVISKKDYPTEKIKTTLGVPDDYLFEFSIPLLNQLNQKQKPFFSVFMTSSNHGPFYVPEYFTPHHTDKFDRSVEYADYSLRKFITLCSKQTWFDSTLFVFVADHGAPLSGLYSMSIDYNHTPLLFYAPSIIKEKKTFNQMAGQIDVFPTLMGLLKTNYVNYTLGIDLLREERPYIYFNADDKYGVMDQEWFLIVNKDKTITLFNYKNKDLHDYAKEKPEVVERMNLYAQSNLQTYQTLLTSFKH